MGLVHTSLMRILHSEKNTKKSVNETRGCLHTLVKKDEVVCRKDDGDDT